MTAVSMKPAETGGHVETLGALAPFQDLPEAVISLLCAHSERRSYSAGQTVFSLGQYDGGEFLVVLSGSLRVSVADGETGAMLIDDVREKEIFGLEIAMAEADPALFQHIGVTAKDDCEAIVIDAAEFKSLAASRPSLMRNIAEYLSAKLISHRYKPATAHSAPESRIYTALLEAVKRDPVSGAWRIERMPKHRELADKAGVEETAAAAAIASLIQDGVAQRDYPGLVINDMARLNRLAS